MTAPAPIMPGMTVRANHRLGTFTGVRSPGGMYLVVLHTPFGCQVNGWAPDNTMQEASDYYVPTGWACWARSVEVV